MAEPGEQGIETVFSRPVSVTGAGGPLAGRIEATAAERTSLAELFHIENLGSFTFDYAIEPIAGERRRLTGDLRADLTQLCVLTLEPVAEHVEEQVLVECWPQELIDREQNADPAPDPEGIPPEPPAPIVNGKVDVGAVAAEILASAINPYPRKDGVEFAWDDPKVGPPETSGPFAGLAKLKSKR